jgi:hypothetical protein
MDFALAYIDPGSGSMILYAIVASALAVPFYLRTQIGRAVGRLRGHPAAPTASPGSHADAGPAGSASAATPTDPDDAAS